MRIYRIMLGNFLEKVQGLSETPSWTIEENKFSKDNCFLERSESDKNNV